MCDNPIDPIKNIPKSIGSYILNQELGRGSFGVVYLGTNQFTGTQAAVKILDKAELQQDESALALVNHEVSILKMLFHKNIAKLYEVFESAMFIYIVSEYCEGKELFDHIYLNKSLPESEALTLFQSIIDAMIYIHSLEICHRDIKPENILLTKGNRPKLIDFGFSCQYSSDKLLIDDYGTPSYACPEIHLGKEYHAMLADSWSCGVLLYVMVCGYLPFSEEDDNANKALILKGDYDLPDELSEPLKDLIKNMMKVDSMTRFTFDEVKEHPWFTSNSPKLIGGINLAEVIYPIDERILMICEQYGFKADIVREGLEANKFNNATAVYQLCVKTIIDRGMESISDLCSEQFEEYLADPTNYINYIGEEEEVEEDDNLANATKPSEADKPLIKEGLTSSKKSIKNNDNQLSNRDEKYNDPSSRKGTIDNYRKNQLIIPQSDDDKGRTQSNYIEGCPNKDSEKSSVILNNNSKPINMSKMTRTSIQLQKDELIKLRNPRRRRNAGVKIEQIENALKNFILNQGMIEEERNTISSASSGSISKRLLDEKSTLIIPEEQCMLTTDDNANAIKEALVERSSRKNSLIRKGSLNSKENSLLLNGDTEKVGRQKSKLNFNSEFKDDDDSFDEDKQSLVEIQFVGNQLKGLESSHFNNHNNDKKETEELKRKPSKNNNNTTEEKKPSILKTKQANTYEDRNKKGNNNDTTKEIIINYPKGLFGNNNNDTYTRVIKNMHDHYTRVKCDSVDQKRDNTPVPVRDLSFSPKLGALNNKTRMEKIPWVKKKEALEHNQEMEQYLCYKAQHNRDKLFKKNIKTVKAIVKPLITDDPYTITKDNLTLIKKISIHSPPKSKIHAKQSKSTILSEESKPKSRINTIEDSQKTPTNRGKKNKAITQRIITYNKSKSKEKTSIEIYFEHKRLKKLYSLRKENQQAMSTSFNYNPTITDHLKQSPKTMTKKKKICFQNYTKKISGPLNTVDQLRKITLGKLTYTQNNKKDENNRRDIYEGQSQIKTDKKTKKFNKSLSYAGNEVDLLMDDKITIKKKDNPFNTRHYKCNSYMDSLLSHRIPKVKANGNSYVTISAKGLSKTRIEESNGQHLDNKQEGIYNQIRVSPHKNHSHRAKNMNGTDIALDKSTDIISKQTKMQKKFNFNKTLSLTSNPVINCKTNPTCILDSINSYTLLTLKKTHNSSVSNKEKFNKIQPKDYFSSSIDISCLSYLTLENTLQTLMNRLRKYNILFIQKDSLYDFRCTKSGSCFDIEIVRLKEKNSEQNTNNVYYYLIKLKNNNVFQLKKQIVCALVE